MEQGNLIDTSCIIDFANGKLPDGGKVYLSSALDNQPCISVINKIEILGFSNPSQSNLELVNTIMIIGLTNEIVDETIKIRRLYKIKLPDAIIAATALHKNLVLITRNVADFKMIKGLALANPWDK
jgi:predicted nucleic acid-binding protein